MCSSNCSLQLKKESPYCIPGYTVCTQFNSFSYSFHFACSRKLDSHIISSKGSAEYLLGHFSYCLPGISHPRIQTGGVALGIELLKHFCPSLCTGAVLS